MLAAVAISGFGAGNATRAAAAYARAADSGGDRRRAWFRRVAVRYPPTPRRIGDVPHRTSGQISIRSEEHTSELQSLMRISYAVFCLNKKTKESNNMPTMSAKKSLR